MYQNCIQRITRMVRLFTRHWRAFVHHRESCTNNWIPYHVFYYSLFSISLIYLGIIQKYFCRLPWVLGAVVVPWGRPNDSHSGDMEGTVTSKRGWSWRRSTQVGSGYRRISWGCGHRSPGGCWTATKLHKIWQGHSIVGEEWLCRWNISSMTGVTNNVVKNYQYQEFQGGPPVLFSSISTIRYISWCTP